MSERTAGDESLDTLNQTLNLKMHDVSFEEECLTICKMSVTATSARDAASLWVCRRSSGLVWGNLQMWLSNTGNNHESAWDVKVFVLLKCCRMCECVLNHLHSLLNENGTCVWSSVCSLAPRRNDLLVAPQKASATPPSFLLLSLMSRTIPSSSAEP